MKRFNIRLYAIIINEEGDILLCDEVHRDKHMIKFPGGGLEWGEGTVDCLKRELMEEFDLQLLEHHLFYVTDFFQASFFNADHQVVSIYYKCKIVGSPNPKEENVKFFWADFKSLEAELMTFPIDKHVIGLLKKELNQL